MGVDNGAYQVPCLRSRDFDRGGVLPSVWSPKSADGRSSGRAEVLRLRGPGYNEVPELRRAELCHAPSERICLAWPWRRLRAALRALLCLGDGGEGRQHGYLDLSYCR